MTIERVYCPHCGSTMTYIKLVKKSDEKEEKRYLMTETCKSCKQSSGTFDVEVEIIGGNEK